MQKRSLHKITLKLLKTIYTSVGNRSGWDFSRMKTEKETPPWDYVEIVLRYIKATNYVLDIGTGGGEKFIKLSKYFLKGVGIDPYIDIINAAKNNKTQANNTRVSFRLMGAENIRFPKNTFDVVLNRHAVIVPKEVAKVLKPKGYFITEQVEKNNMSNLKQVFKYKKVWQNDALTLSREFEKNKCRIIATGKYNINYWVKDLESLIFWLKAVNLPENFNIEDHGLQLLKFIKKFKTPKGFITNESREFLIARKE